MKKAEIIERMADEAGISKTAAGSALGAFTDCVTEALQGKEEKVTLTGFGTFSISNRKARKGVNPQTGETIDIKASKSVKFKAGKKLKDAIA
jgi:DNA-binding protein HU-beta